MAAQRATYIVDLLDQHVDELGFLWGRWRAALRDPDYTITAAGELEERIRGHLQGVQVPGEKAWPRLLELLAGDEPDLIFAAAYALLHSHQAELTQQVLDAFTSFDAERFDAVAAALAHGPLPQPAIDAVRTLLGAEPTMRALAAAEVLAFHDALELSGEQLRYFLEHEDAPTRVRAWRLAALIGAQLPPKAYAVALRDAEPAVAMAAMETGAWCGVTGVLLALRQRVDDSPDQLEAWQLLAAIGTAEDATRVQAAIRNAALGPQRFALAATFGSPALLPIVLDALSDPDPATAAAAGSAFQRITGIDVDSNQRATAPPEAGKQPDAFDAEFQAEVMLPDAARARREWEQVRAPMETRARLCRGIDANSALDADVTPRIDMQHRWEAHLRARFTQMWPGTLLDLERFPQSAAPRPERAAADNRRQLVTARS